MSDIRHLPVRVNGCYLPAKGILATLTAVSDTGLRANAQVRKQGDFDSIGQSWAPERSDISGERNSSGEGITGDFEPRSAAGRQGGPYEGFDRCYLPANFGHSRPSEGLEATLKVVIIMWEESNLINLKR